jgi:CheY-like chemotaxis protein
LFNGDETDARPDVAMPMSTEPTEVPIKAGDAVPQRVLRVLLAEDTPDHQRIVAYILRGSGHSVDIAEDGPQAIRMAQENCYDLILMDVKMPCMDGLEATKAIRATENGNWRLPIIAITAHAMKGDRERCLAAGMDGYLSKPINGHEMIVLVENLAAAAAAAAAATSAVARAEEHKAFEEAG